MIKCELGCGIAGGWSDVTCCRCILGQVWHGRGGAVHRGAARQTLAHQGDVQTQPAAGPQASNQSEPKNTQEYLHKYKHTNKYEHKFHVLYDKICLYEKYLT